MAFKLPGLSLGSSKAAPPLSIMGVVNESGTTQDPSARPQLRGKSAAEQLRMLRVPFLIFAALTTALVLYQIRVSSFGTAYVDGAGQMRTLSQQIAKASQLALQGDPNAFGELEQSRARFNQLLDAVTNGGDVNGTGVPGGSSAVEAELAAVTELWKKTDANAEKVLKEKKNLTALGASIANINAKNPHLLELSEQIAALKLQGGASAREIATASQVVMLTQRIAKNANALQVANAIDPDVTFLLGKDTNTFREQLEQLQKMTSEGSDAKAKLNELEAVAKDNLAAVSAILGSIQLLVQAKQAGSQIFQDSTALLEKTTALTEGYNGAYTGFFTWVSLAIIVCALLALACLALMAKTYNDDIARRHKAAEQLRDAAETERNGTQQAILRLMNEMGDLADGDLTVRATVTEDITGAIADSVNYTIEELSVLVRRINDASIRVTTATESAQRTSDELLSATERQAQELRLAGETAQSMASSMSAASEDALQSAQVARRSLEAAQKGAAAVEDTIKGMNDIREKIQETSKRIKRLGESSQEIGEIVELISDITEQTNVLALNAAIQAASAGEAGRGFSVVAEEVQRLAERSAEATKQIGAIVKTIQTDTGDAVAAMENATRDVVDGARLSETAGQELAEIERVSAETATLIERISSSTEVQAKAATQVAEKMKNILAITDRTTTGTQQTAVSIGELADLAIELKGSVSGFKV
ncbi:MAG: type IV pili methyl-accepting chemotaxis transducer N-terminal domain-containing protein [Zoogloea sp.]|jgi:twitching motility protein PilJ|uniref:methyl-accepting chemotaxis protein n=1 Tax=Zoogloea ramigera TaxID=350 RepID=UPI001B3DA0C2|nr:type IV pili methyl-accepting chemotaxis transducer N-terminal domain-containing protein [Zoogloea sp.]MBP7626220.1 type IV pili methyl-accepting chemotaxis transducer N-terminal domain-containing protein [Zoogloea sp.]